MEFLRDVQLQSQTTSNIEADDTCTDEASTFDDVEELSSSGRESRDELQHRKKKGSQLYDEIRQLLHEPINMDLPAAEPDESTAFCMVVASKLKQLNDSTRMTAMIRILEVLRQELKNSTET
ncbi:PREDICTED: uncharacterized protein LOC105557403 isoform X2 [Vollenhovia emeryi]|uniref:uncharacterized protein LOC105557403 isoform X2 n=1 Tax=Vollenhovia emeryi TaxID=411798 RepID=UPI0005F4F10F|nr:PREDICTED: uncharacterized protein LOC105557403 isoform X2 [Vollenhovia emeryi]